MKNNDAIRSLMYSYIEKWRRTDLNMKTFCIEQNISYYSFKYWKYRQRDEKSSRTSEFLEDKNTEELGKFLPMQINTHPIVSGYVVNFPNGVQLNCPSNVGLDSLSKLIKSF